ncbi:MAG: hypothetical protein ACKVOJ_00490, partial [Sphingomonadaceae bacterium]
MMADSEADGETDLVEQFLASGLVGLLEVKEVRQACEIGAREMGCVAPTNKIAVWLMVQLVGYVEGLASDWMKDRLIQFAQKCPPVLAFLRHMMSIEAECTDKMLLRETLIRRLRGEEVDPPEADYSTSDEMLAYLWNEQKFAALDQSVQAM